MALIWIEVDTSVIMNRAIRRDRQYFGGTNAVRNVYENRCLPAQDYHILRDLPKQNTDITATFANELWIVREKNVIRNRHEMRKRRGSDNCQTPIEIREIRRF